MAMVMGNFYPSTYSDGDFAREISDKSGSVTLKDVLR
jgi:hypothetical protein